jgi:hypothetical protein
MKILNITKNNIMKFIKYYSYKERRNREYKILKKEMENLENLPSSFLKAEYILTKSKYDFKKLKLTLIYISVALAIVVGVLSKLFYAFEKIAHFISSNTKNIEAGKAFIILSLVISILIIASVVIFLIYYIKNMQLLYKHLLTIEEVIKIKNESDK